MIRKKEPYEIDILKNYVTNQSEKVSTFTLVSWKDLPPCFYHIFQDLQAIILKIGEVKYVNILELTTTFRILI